MTKVLSTRLILSPFYVSVWLIYSLLLPTIKEHLSILSIFTNFSHSNGRKYFTSPYICHVLIELVSCLVVYNDIKGGIRVTENTFCREYCSYIKLILCQSLSFTVHSCEGEVIANGS